MAPGRVLKSLALFGVLWLGLAATGYSEYEGQFDTVGPLPKEHSVQVVVFDEYLNFSCPHCNNFREAAKPLKKKFGKRLKITYYPVLFRGQTDGPLRLFFVGQAAGRTEEIKNIIFDAAFVSNVNIYDPAVINYLARSTGLGEVFRKQRMADWVTEKVNEARQRANIAGVKVTPTVVLQGAMRVEPNSGMQAYVGNLERLIEKLLK